MYSSGMTSDDCYLLGKYAAEILDFKHATLWYLEALSRLYDEDVEKKADIQLRLINSTLEQSFLFKHNNNFMAFVNKIIFTDKFADALYYINELLKTTPNDKHLINYRSYLTEEINRITPKDQLEENITRKVNLCSN